MASAAGGTSQRLNPGGAMIRSLSSSPMMPLIKVVPERSQGAATLSDSTLGASGRGALSRYVALTVAAAASTVLGVIWDISWHRSIGRDTLWTPAHLAIYFGGLLAGAGSAWLVFSTTFGHDDARRAAAVRFWGFRAPLGAWLCIWGAIAMLTSAPFDNWWHNAYGLDV